MSWSSMHKFESERIDSAYFEITKCTLATSTDPEVIRARGVTPKLRCRRRRGRESLEHMNIFPASASEHYGLHTSIMRRT
jgi:hypothetical protein